jgi:hypothetical protein
VCWQTDRHTTIANRVDVLLRNAHKNYVELWHANLPRAVRAQHLEFTGPENKWTPVLECRSIRSQPCCRRLQQLSEVDWSFIKSFNEFEQRDTLSSYFPVRDACYLRHSFIVWILLNFTGRKMFLSTILERNEMSVRGPLTRALLFRSFHIRVHKCHISYPECRVDICSGTEYWIPGVMFY